MNLKEERCVQEAAYLGSVCYRTFGSVCNRGEGPYTKLISQKSAELASICVSSKKIRTTTFSPVNVLTENPLPYIFIRKALTFLYFFIMGLPAQASPHNRDVTGSPLTEAHSVKNNEAARNDPQLQALKKRAME